VQLLREYLKFYAIVNESTSPSHSKNGFATHGYPLVAVRIVLVEPAGPLNVGAIARVMKNMGLQQLVLVNPQCDPLSLEAQQMAVHAFDILQAAQVVETLPAALQGCTRAIATTARPRTLDIPLELPQDALPWLILAPGQATALIFGPESRGLSNEEMYYAQRFICIPSNPAYPSLNLAQAVTICCYELAKYSQLAANDENSAIAVDYASVEALEGFYEQLEVLLLKIGYLYPHTATSRMEKFRQLFNRAQLENTEVAMLRGILTQMEWAIQNSGVGKRAEAEETSASEPRSR
jgi:tRNA/rRNA methyltransferase